MNSTTSTQGARPQRLGALVVSALAICALALSSCSVTASVETTPLALTPAVTYYPTGRPPATATPPATPTPTVRAAKIDPNLPADMAQALSRAITPTGLTIASSAMPAGASVVAEFGADVSGNVVFTRVYALAAPFPTVADGATFKDLQAFWSGDANALRATTNAGGAPTLFMDANTRQALTTIFKGGPAATAKVSVVEPSALAKSVFDSASGALAVLPFEQLDQRWKVLRLDDLNVFDKQMDAAKYPLALRVREKLAPSQAAVVAPQTNRDPNKMAVVAMTGVTALVRGTALKMQQKGLTYPGAKIRDWLKSADVTHISNEISFYEKCPPPSLNEGTRFCSRPSDIELLKDVGTDVIDLTGNHLWDYGWQNLLTTLDTYDQLGWEYFGGGRNFKESLRPVTMTVNGNKIAFVGCNWFGSDWATDRLAGSMPCGADDPRKLDLIVPMIQQLRKDGYNVIATLQYEEYYRYDSTLNQQRDFRALRDAGAVVVNGSQGHHVQGFDVNDKGFMHFGTGNLFFGDQTFSKGAQQTFVDRHVFYDGKYLGTDLRSAFIEDMSQPRPMTPKERAELLGALFKASFFNR